MKRVFWLSNRHGLRRHLAAVVVPAQPELGREPVRVPAQQGQGRAPARLVPEPVLVPAPGWEPVPEQGQVRAHPPLVPAAALVLGLVLLPQR